MHTIISALALAAVANATPLAQAAQFCGVVTTPVMSYVDCNQYQFPVMNQACTSIGGTVAGHNIESGDARSNCIVYCNNVATGGHDVSGSITQQPSIPLSRNTTYHLYVVDSCNSCDYCGPSH